MFLGGLLEMFLKIMHFIASLEKMRKEAMDAEEQWCT